MRRVQPYWKRQLSTLCIFKVCLFVVFIIQWNHLPVSFKTFHILLKNIIRTNLRLLFRLLSVNKIALADCGLQSCTRLPRYVLKEASPSRIEWMEGYPNCLWQSSSLMTLMFKWFYPTTKKHQDCCKSSNTKITDLPAFLNRLLVPKATAVMTVGLCFNSTALATVTMGNIWESCSDTYPS